MPTDEVDEVRCAWGSDQEYCECCLEWLAVGLLCPYCGFLSRASSTRDELVGDKPEWTCPQCRKLDRVDLTAGRRRLLGDDGAVCHHCGIWFTRGGATKLMKRSEC